MTIYVDADACPKVIKSIVYKAADRTHTQVILVANRALTLPPSLWVKCVQVPAGFDQADDYIVAQIAPDDLVITADIPLADQVIAQQGVALNPRGQWYDHNNIKHYLQRRDMAEQRRACGLETSGPKAIGKRDVQQFANALDRYLTRYQ